MFQFYELGHKWRAVAREWREGTEDGDPEAIQAVYKEMASVMEACSNELDATIEDSLNETLTIPQAARASGYSAEALRRAVRRGTIPNAGRKGSPKIRRVDLPRKLNGAKQDA